MRLQTAACTLVLCSTYAAMAIGKPADIFETTCLTEHAFDRPAGRQSVTASGLLDHHKPRQLLELAAVPPQHGLHPGFASLACGLFPTP